MVSHGPPKVPQKPHIDTRTGVVVEQKTVTHASRAMAVANPFETALAQHNLQVEGVGTGVSDPLAAPYRGNIGPSASMGLGTAVRAAPSAMRREARQKERQRLEREMAAMETRIAEELGVLKQAEEERTILCRERDELLVDTARTEQAEIDRLFREGAAAEQEAWRSTFDDRTTTESREEFRKYFRALTFAEVSHRDELERLARLEQKAIRDAEQTAWYEMTRISAYADLYKQLEDADGSRRQHIDTLQAMSPRQQLEATLEWARNRRLWGGGDAAIPAEVLQSLAPGSPVSPPLGGAVQTGAAPEGDVELAAHDAAMQRELERVLAEGRIRELAQRSVRYSVALYEDQKLITATPAESVNSLDAEAYRKRGHGGLSIAGDTTTGSLYDLSYSPIVDFRQHLHQDGGRADASQPRLVANVSDADASRRTQEMGEEVRKALTTPDARRATQLPTAAWQQYAGAPSPYNATGTFAQGIASTATGDMTFPLPTPGEAHLSPSRSAGLTSRFASQHMSPAHVAPMPSMQGGIATPTQGGSFHSHIMSCVQNVMHPSTQSAVSPGAGAAAPPASHHAPPAAAYMADTASGTPSRYHAPAAPVAMPSSYSHSGAVASPAAHSSVPPEIHQLISQHRGTPTQPQVQAQDAGAGGQSHSQLVHTMMSEIMKLTGERDKEKQAVELLATQLHASQQQMEKTLGQMRRDHQRAVMSQEAELQRKAEFMDHLKHDRARAQDEALHLQREMEDLMAETSQLKDELLVKSSVGSSVIGRSTPVSAFTTPVKPTPALSLPVPAPAPTPTPVPAPPPAASAPQASPGAGLPSGVSPSLVHSSVGVPFTRPAESSTLQDLLRPSLMAAKLRERVDELTQQQAVAAGDKMSHLVSTMQSTREQLHARLRGEGVMPDTAAQTPPPQDARTPTPARAAATPLGGQGQPLAFGQRSGYHMYYDQSEPSEAPEVESESGSIKPVDMPATAQLEPGASSFAFGSSTPRFTSPALTEREKVLLGPTGRKARRADSPATRRSASRGLSSRASSQAGSAGVGARPAGSIGRAAPAAASALHAGPRRMETLAAELAAARRKTDQVLRMTDPSRGA